MFLSLCTGFIILSKTLCLVDLSISKSPKNFLSSSIDFFSVSICSFCSFLDFSAASSASFKTLSYAVL
nr:MAG TPA: hypothetical protein [Crassvirales sp.]